jgi:hypothetical protein
MELPPFLPTNTHDIDARWTSLFDTTRDSAGLPHFRLDDALELFDELLGDSSHRHYLIPFLSVVVTILGSHTLNSDLADFLHACCTKLDYALEVNHPCSVLYQYVLAFGIDDEAMMARQGDRLGAAVTSTARSFGNLDVASIAAENFGVWHKMRVQSADPLLIEHELRTCILGGDETCGRHSLLPINSSALLGRLLQEQGKYTEADEILTDALARLSPCPELFQAYKLEIMQRLSVVERANGRIARAGNLLLDVYSRRTEILGPRHIYTLGALEQLRELFADLGS